MMEGEDDAEIQRCFEKAIETVRLESAVIEAAIAWAHRVGNDHDFYTAQAADELRGAADALVKARGEK